MNRLSAFIAELHSLFPEDPPYLVTAYKIILVIAGFLIAWLFLRALLHFVEKRISKYEYLRSAFGGIDY